MIIFGNKDPTPNLDPESAVPLLPITSAQPGLTAAATVPDATCNAGTVCALVPCFSRRKQVFRWCRKARRRLLFPLFTVVLGVLFVLHVYPVLQNELQRYRVSLSTVLLIRSCLDSTLLFCLSSRTTATFLYLWSTYLLADVPTSHTGRAHPESFSLI